MSFPSGKIVAVVGVSGSGKSSLVWNTLVAEARRRYLACLEPEARSLLARLPRPDVDAVVHVPPVVALEQAAPAAQMSRRHTVATVSGLHELLALIYGHRADAVCPTCDMALKTLSADDMADLLDGLAEGTRFQLLATLFAGAADAGDGSAPAEAVRTAVREGFVRVRLDGVVQPVDPLPETDWSRVRRVDVVVDRQVARQGQRDRLLESIQVALRLGMGRLIVSRDLAGDWVDETLSLHPVCAACGYVGPTIEPAAFRPGSTSACPDCNGAGSRWQIPWPDLLAPSPASLAAGAIDGLEIPAGAKYEVLRRCFTPVDPTQAGAWADWKAGDSWVAGYADLWPGTDRRPGLRDHLLQLADLFPDDDGPGDLARAWRRRLIEREFEEACPRCNGARMSRGIALARVADIAFERWLLGTVRAGLRLLAAGWMAGEADPRLVELVEEARRRLVLLDRLGLGHLTLCRPAVTLSGGELQRLRLAGCVGGGLANVAYVFDEPSTGLHAAELDRLVDVLETLKGQGSTVIVVDHELRLVARCDWLVELGPGAGAQGGQLVADGPMSKAPELPGLTAEYLSGRRAVRPRQRPGSDSDASWITLANVSGRHLKGFDLRIPKGRLTAVVGVSGSGKTTLVRDVFVPAVRRHLEQLVRGGRPAAAPAGKSVRTMSLAGMDGIGRLVTADQRALGDHPLSTPASVLGLMPLLRALFSKTADAKTLGMKPASFSLQSAEGRCPMCKGRGFERVDAGVADELVACPQCGGARYHPNALRSRFRGRTIADVLDLPIDEAAAFFQAHVKIGEPLAMLAELDLGYLRLGQPTGTLSGGERQRLKLATDLRAGQLQRTLFVLDEPTAGLHVHDVDRLLAVVDRMVAGGATVVVVEHHLEVVKAADWVVELGPGPGPEGGELIFAGTVAELAAGAATPTARALRHPFSIRVDDAPTV